MCAAPREPSIHIGGDMSGQFVMGNNNTTTSAAPNPYLPRSAAPENPAKRKRIFVSYVREDMHLVDRLVAELRAAGHDPWIDRDGLLPGMDWPTEIRKAIRTSDHFLACFTPNYWKRRTYMNDELRSAITQWRQVSIHRNWLIPAKLLPCELPELRTEPGEYLTDTIQVADFASDWTSALRQLLAVLGR